MKTSVSALALTVAAAAFGLSVASAQGVPPSGGPPPGVGGPPAFKNLQVFPKDIARPELIANMRFFAQSLGVRCTFCHVGVEGQPPSTYDFASDAKKEKQVARKMMLMVQRINTQDFGVQPALATARVTCFTCHRGSPHPLKTPPAETQGATPAAAPAPSAAPPAPPRRPERGAV